MIDLTTLPSFVFRKEIEKIINKNFLGLHDIHHFSINLMLTNKMVVLSSNLNLVQSFQESGLESHYLAYSPEVYKKNLVYSWEDCYVGPQGKKIHNMISYQNRLHNGTMIIRNMGSYSIMYSIATNYHHPIYHTLYFNLADDILKAGDFAFNELKDCFSEKAGLELPLIKKFRSISDMRMELKQNGIESNLLNLVEQPHYNLTPKEIECLYWARHGKSAEETAIILGRTLETIKTHLKSVRYKMNCTSIGQAIGEAISCGLFK